MIVRVTQFNKYCFSLYQIHLISWKLIAYYDTFGLGKCSLVVTGLFFSSGKGTAVDRLVWFVDLVNMLLISFERGEESVST